MYTDVRSSARSWVTSKFGMQNYNYGGKDIMISYDIEIKPRLIFTKLLTEIYSGCVDSYNFSYYLYQMDPTVISTIRFSVTIKQWIIWIFAREMKVWDKEIFYSNTSLLLTWIYVFSRMLDLRFAPTLVTFGMIFLSLQMWPTKLVGWNLHGARSNTTKALHMYLTSLAIISMETKDPFLWVSHSDTPKSSFSVTKTWKLKKIRPSINMSRGITQLS